MRVRACGGRPAGSCMAALARWSPAVAPAAAFSSSKMPWPEEWQRTPLLGKVSGPLLRAVLFGLVLRSKQ